MASIDESVQAGRLFNALRKLYETFGLTDREYMDHILPKIPESRIWDIDRAEREIRAYVLSKSKQNASAS